MPYACRALAREMPRPRRAGDDGPAAGAGRTWVAAAQVGKVLDHPLLLQLAMDRRWVGIIVLPANQPHVHGQVRRWLQ
jgi:hypothetical protein